MDNFAEQLVKKELTKSDKTHNIIILILGIFMVLFFLSTSVLTIGRGGLFAFIGVILALAFGFLTFSKLQNTKVEYEYTFTNGELDIDKIIAQKKRKEMLTVQVGKFTDFGRYNENAPEEPDDMTVVFATNNIVSQEYYADFQHEEYGKTRLVFCPDERMMENITRALPNILKNRLC